MGQLFVFFLLTLFCVKIVDRIFLFPFFFFNLILERQNIVKMNWGADGS